MKRTFCKIVLKLVLQKRRCIKKRQMVQCSSPFLSVTPRWPVKITKTSLKQETFRALSIIEFQETLQKIISSDYNAIRYVYTFLSRYTTFTILLGKIVIACNYGKLVKALKQSFILFIYLFWLTTNNLTLCWFSISLSCFVNAVNDSLASGWFCQ